MESSEEFTLGQQEQVRPQNLSESTPHVWTEDEISLMVQIRLFINPHFEKGRLTSMQIWKCILDNMVKDLDTCKDLTILDCLTKWEELVRKYYRLEYDITVTRTKKHFKYYEQLHQIYKNKPIPDFSETSNSSLSSMRLSQEQMRQNKENVSLLEYKKYKLKYAALMWQQRKWREKKQMMKQQHELLENLNSGLQEIVQYIKNS